LRYLAENLLAFFDQDYYKVAQLHLKSGWIPHGVNVNDLESSIRSICEPIFDRPLKDISAGETLLKLIKLAHTYKLIVQPQLLLLQKTLVAVEGLSRELDPAMNLWTVAHPYIKTAVKNNFGFKAELTRFIKESPFVIDSLHEKYINRPQTNKTKSYYSSISTTLIGLSILFNYSLYLLECYKDIQIFYRVCLLHLILWIVVYCQKGEVV
jgi:predicted unusual protein kinase regulating ubiquinone biosynthesis (AarF/ABC1/UbiB family)